MIILISGGFVVIGEVVLPALTIPIIDLLFSNLTSPLKESLRVFIGYCSMTIATFFASETTVLRLGSQNQLSQD